MARDQIKRAFPVALAAFAAALAATLAAPGSARAADPVGQTRPQDPAWENAYLQRLATVVGAKTWAVGNGEGDTDIGKRDWPGLLAEMWKVRDNPKALDQLIATKGKVLMHSTYAGTFHKPFSAPGYALYYFLFKDRLPADQKAQARKMIDTVGWGQMTRPDHKMDPIYPSSEFNSENFNWMARLTGFLFAHEFKEPERQRYFDAYVDNFTRALFNAGRVEWDSNNYWGYCFQPVLVMHRFAPSDKSRLQAQAAADWMVLTMALHYTDGFLVGPDVRAKSGAYEKFAGSAWMYGWLYFADPSRHFPSFSQADVKAHPEQNLAGFAAWSDYRPPQVALDIAQRNFATPVEMHNAKPFYGLDEDNYAAWKGDSPKGRRFEFETLYLEKDYTLGSLATYRPDGHVGTFSEQSVWRLGVRQKSGGGVQVFGNSGDLPTMAGRCPQEEVGQYANAMLRIARGIDTMWIAVPKEAPQGPGENGSYFADLGDVYVAWTPVGIVKAGPGSAPAAGKKGGFTTTHQQYVWTVSGLAGLAMEVGTKAEHGSYAAFKEAIGRRARITRDADKTVAYTSTAGKVLKMEYVPPATYTLHDGKVVSPAGVPGKVWCDGQPVDYASWNSYQVVRGEKILEQKWGSGTMTAQVRGQGLEITVDPSTAAVTYKPLTPGK